MSIAENLAEVRGRIARAAIAAGRDPSAISLVAVSKFQPESAIREAWAAGQRLFGENYAQELRDKAMALSDLEGLRFHFIGSLQKNKAKYVAQAPSVEVYESLDDLGVAAEMDRRLEALSRAMGVLIEISFGEGQKGGVAGEELDGFIRALAAFPRLRVEGLMAIPPFTQVPEDTRPYFQKVATLARERRLPVVSMGMSSDFEIAIAEGATHVRVGTALFGTRPPKTPG